MHPTNTRIRRLVCGVALALTALAALAPGAGASTIVNDAKPRAFVPGVTDFPSRLGEAGAAVQAEEFVPGVTDFPGRFGEIGERAAQARLAQRSQQGQPVRIEESGFDWGAGATGAIAATLLLFGAALAVRTAKRSRVALG